MSINIPAIDYSTLGTDAQISKLIYACEQYGFFQIVNHGIEKTQYDAFLSLTKAFFRLPADQKKALLRTVENPWGFYDQELTKNKKDWKQVFDFGIDQHDADYPTISRWPDDMPFFRETMLNWFNACEEVSLVLLRAITATLSPHTDALSHFFSPMNTSFVRLNYYPVCDDPADSTVDNPTHGHLGVSHHTDAGALTVLIQDDVPGLQIRQEGLWQTVYAEPDALIVNIGDLMQVWSNGRYKAALHRVKANGANERFSAPFFFNPVYSCDCKPLNNEETPQYRSVNWKEFRKARTDGDYADVGVESQISDYLIG